MYSPSKYRIITNNPLALRCIPDYYQIEYRECSYREILVTVRDLVYAGHRLYTHPLSGSVKPNETPYKSVVISKTPLGMDLGEAEIMSNSLVTFDKFTPKKIPLTEQVLRDFQLIDYTLLCGAVGLDAAAGLSNKK